MKKGIISLLISILPIVSAISQDTVALWPIQGKKAGEGILYKPQDFINEEKNSNDLFITAPEGTPVLAPMDGTILSISYNYQSSLINIRSFKVEIKPTTDLTAYDKKQREQLAESKDLQAQFINLSISILTKNGEIYSLVGLRPTTYFNTGQLIKKGDIIGTVGYCYKSIPKPCIILSRDKNRRVADPMAPFGIKSSYIPPVSKDPNTMIPVNELLADFEILRDALEEGHPGLYDYTTPQNMNLAFDNVKQKIIHPMTSQEFLKLFAPVLDSIRDSHTSIYNINPGGSPNDNCDIPVHFGALDDSIIIFQATSEYQNLIGKRIIKINNESASEIIRKVSYGRNDGYITGQRDYYRFVGLHMFYRLYHKYKTGDTLTLTFADKSKANMVYKPAKELASFAPSGFRKESRTGNLNMKKLTTETAYLGIKTFALTEMDLQRVNTFIKEISDSSYRNLIIDIRGNRGGDNSFAKIYSLLAQQPFKTQAACMVTRNGKYDLFKNCSNYGPESPALFPDFVPIEGKKGFYSLHSNISKPNDSINYKGKLYLLTDQNSISASTLFAALVYKYKRGTIIGRETGSAYYQMNAAKFANIYLKNSALELRIPLVKDIFDDEINPGIPWGRGVIPDYPVAFSYNEIYGDRDKILNYALEIIEESKK